MSGERAEREEMDDEKGKEIKFLESQALLELTKERNGRKESENFIMKHVDEKIFALTLDLAKEKKSREEVEI